MDIPTWSIVLATLLAPLVAVHIQRHLDILREQRQRRKRVFETLMATRMARLSGDHVRALNMIDIEFDPTNSRRRSRRHQFDRAVIDAWRVYHDHLGQPLDPDSIAEQRRRHERTDELFLDVLASMSVALGYQFDRVVLHRGCYAPQGHADLENEHFKIRKGVIDLLEGQSSLQVHIDEASSSPSDRARVEQVQNALLDVLTGTRPVCISPTPIEAVLPSSVEK